MDRLFLTLLAILLLVSACGGGGDSTSGGESDLQDNRAILTRLVEHYNTATEIALTGSSYSEFYTFAAGEEVTAETDCFTDPALTEESYLDGREMYSESATQLCFTEAHCVTLGDDVALEFITYTDQTQDTISKYNLVTEDGGHVRASVQRYYDLPAKLSLSVYESVTDSVSCGDPNYSDFSPLNGEYSGYIYYTAPNDRTAPLRTEKITMFCNSNSCTLGDNTILLSETSSNTYRVNFPPALSADHLEGEFRSEDDNRRYGFIGGASTSGKVMAGFAFYSDVETTNCSEEGDCLLLVFSRNDQ